MDLIFWDFTLKNNVAILVALFSLLMETFLEIRYDSNKKKSFKTITFCAEIL